MQVNSAQNNNTSFQALKINSKLKSKTNKKQIIKPRKHKIKFLISFKITVFKINPPSNNSKFLYYKYDFFIYK